MKDSVSIHDLDAAIAKRLDTYRSDLAGRVFKATQKTEKLLVKLTKERAPKYSGKPRKGGRKSGTFVKAIRGTTEDNGVFGSKAIWYVGGKEYRLTHLLVHGHQLRQGGRTKGNTFLERSVEEAADAYIKELTEAVKDG